MQLRPTMHKEPEARVTRVETPAFNAILRVVTRKYGAEDFCFSESRVQDYMDLRLRGSPLPNCRQPGQCPGIALGRELVPTILNSEAIAT